MPASRSPSRGTKPAAASPPAVRRRSPWPLIVIGLAAVMAAVIAALPASIVTHFLPAAVRADDFSGSLWHGSAGRISINAREAGALEWRLHPTALFGAAVAADLHWVNVGFVLDGAVSVDRHGFTAHGVKGGGPIADLRGLGIAAGWSGIADVQLKLLQGDFTTPLNAAGDVKVSNLTSALIAAGEDLGSYDLRFPGGSANDGNVAAQLTDTGGPLEVLTTITYSAKNRTGVLSGTLKERPEASPALRSQLQNLTQLRGRDPQGRIPVDLEFSL